MYQRVDEWCNVMFSNGSRIAEEPFERPMKLVVSSTMGYRRATMTPVAMINLGAQMQQDTISPLSLALAVRNEPMS